MNIINKFLLTSILALSPVLAQAEVKEEKVQLVAASDAEVEIINNLLNQFTLGKSEAEFAKLEGIKKSGEGSTRYTLIKGYVSATASFKEGKPYGILIMALHPKKYPIASLVKTMSKLYKCDFKEETNVRFGSKITSHRNYNEERKLYIAGLATGGFSIQLVNVL